MKKLIYCLPALLLALALIQMPVFAESGSENVPAGEDGISVLKESDDIIVDENAGLSDSSDISSEENVCLSDLNDILPEDTSVPLYDETDPENEVKAAATEGEAAPFTYRLEDGAVTITGYTGEEGENLMIPEFLTIDDAAYPVTTIGIEAFRYKTGFTGTLTIPKTVTAIHAEAFYGCRGFTALVFAEGSALKTIGKKAFYDCRGFENALALPDSVISIGEAAFQNCKHFTGSWHLPDSLEVLSPNAFADCCNIEGTVTIPAGVAEIGDHCFYMSNGHSSGWQGVGSLRFAEGSVIQRIGSHAFDGNWYFGGGLSFPDSLTEIADYAFSTTYAGNAGPENEGTLTLPPNIKIVGEGAFSLCGFIGDLVIPESLAAEDATLGKKAFDQAGFTGTLTLPATMRSVPEACFRNNDFTGSLNLPEALEEVGVQSFSGCGDFEGDLVIPAGLTVIAQAAFSGFGGHGSLVLPNTLTRIENSGFSGIQCSGPLTIPDSVEYIGSNAFYDCRRFTSLKLPNNPNFTKIEYATFQVFMASSYEYSMGFTGEIVIPDSVTEIDGCAFSGCKKITSVVLPDGLVSIGREAFDYDQALTSITLPETLTSIDYRAFHNCSGLTGDLTIPASMRILGEEAFEGCSSLDGVLTIKSGVQEIGREAFCGCAKLRGRADIPATVTDFESSVFSGCESLEGFSWPDTLTTIPRDTFSNCKSMTGELDLPECVTKIEQGAFNNCSGLTGSLTIPSNMTKIEPQTFNGCSGLSGSLVLPPMLTEIGYNAFGNCSGLTGALNLPATVTVIDAEAFLNCSGFIGALVLPEGLTRIGNSAFEGCSGFTGKLIIPASVTSTNPQMFKGCSGITSLDMRQFDPALSYGVFEDCTGLTGDMTIPAQITTLYYGVFEGCTGLTGTLTIPATVTFLGNDALIGTFFTTIVNESNASCSAIISKDGTYYYADADGNQVDTIETGTYTLVKGAPALIDLSEAVVTAADQTYTGSALTPAPQVTLRGEAVDPDTYTVSYKDNINAGTATVTITGIEQKGTTGEAAANFTIKKADQTITVGPTKVTLSAGKSKTLTTRDTIGDVTYTSADKTIATVGSTNGKVTAKKVGTVKITVTAKETENYNKATKTVTVNVTPAAVTSVTAAVQARGFKLSWKKADGATGYYVYRDDVQIAQIKKGKTVTYTDKTATGNGKKYVYKVAAYAATGTGAFSEKVTAYFLTQPEISSLKSTKAGKATVKWAKNSKGTGYQIEYSMKKDFSSGVKTINVTSAKTTSKTISSLKSKKTWYVRIRVCKKVGKTTWYSSWSEKKSVKVK